MEPKGGNVDHASHPKEEPSQQQANRNVNDAHRFNGISNGIGLLLLRQ